MKLSREHASLFETLFEHSPDPCLLIKKDRFVACNQAAVTMLRASCKEEIFNTHPYDLSPVRQPDGRLSTEKAAELLAAATRQGALRFEWTHKRMDGEEFPAEVSLTTIMDGQEPVIYTVWRDISDRKRAEAKERERTAQVKMLLKFTAEGIYGCDTDGICTFCNDACLEMLGYHHKSDLLGKDLHSLIHHTRPDGSNYPSGECRAFNAFRHAVKMHVDDEIFWRRDGSSFAVEYWSHPIVIDGVYQGAVVAFVDITARKQAADALVKSENLLQSIIETQPACIKLIDDTGHLIMMNRAGLAMLQADTLEQVQEVELTSFISPPYRQAFEELAGRVFQGETGTLEFEIVGLKGRRLLLETSAVPFRNEKNEIRALLGITRDITEQRKLEEQLRQSQKMEVVGSLAGGLAHDFNNVLCGILGMTSLLRAQLAEGKQFTNEELCASLDSLSTLSGRAADIVSRLMVISRKHEASLKPVDLRTVVGNVIRICQNTFDKSINIALEMPDQPIMIQADCVQIEQVLLNLCVNASHAMTIMRKPGDLYGGTLSISVQEQAAGRGQPAVAEGTPLWVLTVTDTGVGMDRETLSRIFDPFFTTKEKGTGLGLAMVYNIVQQHNGFISAESEPGRGTSFQVWLPAITSGGVVGDTGCATETVTGEGVVLVADDEPFIREAAKSILERCGYQVLVAKDGEEAVAVFREHAAEIRIVVMDIIMPKKSGLDAYLDIKKLRPDVKFLFATGFMQDERIAALKERGARNFLAKPYSLQSLASSIAHLLD
ncbi:MAG TPA: PAS domain S-box protein [Geomonas sp.]|nr:PAS domain S-box protein [Geomonas sp.]